MTSHCTLRCLSTTYLGDLYDAADLRPALSAGLLARVAAPEHLWPLTNTALVNQHFAMIEDLEEIQFARCLVLQRRPDSDPLDHLLSLVAEADR